MAWVGVSALEPEIDERIRLICSEQGNQDARGHADSYSQCEASISEEIFGPRRLESKVDQEQRGDEHAQELQRHAVDGLPLPDEQSRQLVKRPGERGFAKEDPRDAHDREHQAPSKPASDEGDRKSTRLNSSHDQISYAVFCLKKKKKKKTRK